MARYRYGWTANTSSAKLEKSRMAIKVTALTLIVLIPAVIYVIISTLPPNPVSGKSIDKGKFDPTITFTTDWFSFVTPKSWEEATNLHIKDKMYVYRENNGGENLGLMKIFVNSDVVSYQNYYTRVLPVKVENGSKLVPRSLEPHCNTVLGPGQNKGVPTIVTQAEVNFLCWVDGTNLYAVAGEIGGSSTLNLKRRNGETARYIITYVNNAFTPSEGSFEQALQSFEAR
jgi:hypothetical protein